MSHTFSQLVAILVMFAVASLFCGSALGQLEIGYYRDTCYDAEEIVRQEVAIVLSVQPNLAGSLLRLHFHDCFVRGCDGSILLDSTGDEMVAQTEKKADTSTGLRGFDVIDRIKQKLEDACPGIVSCADILALVARDAVLWSGGHYWPVPTGRLDGRVSKAGDTKAIPPPTSDISQLVAAFGEKNLTKKDLVVLSGAHSIGSSHCQSFRDRLYGDDTSGGMTATSRPDVAVQQQVALDPPYLNELRSRCGADPAGNMTVEMSPGSSPAGRVRFDTRYYSYVARRRGLFRSDAVLLADDFTGAYVRRHATGRFDDEFYGDFGEAMVKMGGIRPPTTDGEVRRKCSAVNDYY